MTCLCSAYKNILFKFKMLWYLAIAANEERDTFTDVTLKSAAFSITTFYSLRSLNHPPESGNTAQPLLPC